MKTLIITCIALSLSILTGCQNMRVKEDVSTAPIGGYILPQTHYTYPNSNVTPLGPVKGRAMATGTLHDFPNISKAINDAINKAIRKSGGDLLINTTVGGNLNTYSKFEGGKLKIRYEAFVEVQGTAAKMEIGKQKLR